MWKRFVSRVAETLRRDFIAGILVFVPVGFTVIAILWILEQLDNAILPRIFKAFGLSPDQIPFVGVVFTLAVILLLGAMTRSFIGRAALSAWESAVDRVPFARSIYSLLKKFLQAVLQTDTNSSIFSRVVLIQYPRIGIYTYAFVTGPMTERVPGLPPGLTKVFVPSTPNPTTGYFLLLDDSQLIDTGLSVEEAFKLIVSAGVVDHEGDAIEASSSAGA